jgi:hypothetical protein
MLHVAADCALRCVFATRNTRWRRVLQGMFHQAVLADLNTMAHGVARLSPHYCCDAQRFRTLGQTEAEWCAPTAGRLLWPSLRLPHGSCALDCTEIR